MKKIGIFLLLYGLLFVARAQSAASSADEKTVAALVEKLRGAMVSGSRADLEPLVSSELSYAHSDGRVQSREEFVSDITSKKSDFVRIELKKQFLHVIGRTAVVQHVLIADTNDGGKAGHVSLGVVLIWNKDRGTWRLIARRAFKVPEPS
jgi:ketosteroid isomerase-like protein